VEEIDDLRIAGMGKYRASCFLHVSLFQMAHFGRQVDALQALSEPDYVNKLMRQNVSKNRLQAEVSQCGRLEDIMVLQADPIKVSLLDHPWPGLPAEAVAKCLSERVIRNFRGAEGF